MESFSVESMKMTLILQQLLNV